MIGNKTILVNTLLILACFVGGCNTSSKVQVEEYPLFPTEQLQLIEGNVVMVRAPFRTQDSQYHLVSYDETGDPSSKLSEVYDEVIFPTDVFVVSGQDEGRPIVFLARSPHGGCLLRWEQETSELIDPCFGSHFNLNGEYVKGPSRRHLDQLPSDVRNGMIWVKNEIVYGEALE